MRGKVISCHKWMWSCAFRLNLVCGSRSMGFLLGLERPHVCARGAWGRLFFFQCAVIPHDWIISAQSQRLHAPQLNSACNVKELATQCSNRRIYGSRLHKFSCCFFYGANQAVDCTWFCINSLWCQMCLGLYLYNSCLTWGPFCKFCLGIHVRVMQ